MPSSVILPSVFVGVSVVFALTPSSAMALSATEVSEIAQAVTVQIEGQNPGSGVLINRKDNVYTVLTAAHVVATEDEYEVITADNKQHSLSYRQVQKFPGIDLALVEFTSNQSYSIATLGDSGALKSGASVYVSGFPMPTEAITNSIWTFSPGSLTANANSPLADGYALVYTNSTLPGMSGGAVFSEEGTLVGIHGRADAEQHTRKTETVYLKTGFNLGIPIHTFLSLIPQVKPSLTFDVTVTTPQKTGPTADDWYLKARNKSEQEDYRGAIADFTQALELNPRYAKAYGERGIAWSFLGERQKALTDLNQSLALAPDSALYSSRGRVHLKLGRTQDALTDFNRAIKLDPKNAKAYLNRGALKARTRNNQAAIADLNRAIEIDPSLATAYSNRSGVWSAVGDFTRALADADKAVKLNGDVAEFYNNRGRAKNGLGNPQGALADYKTAIQLDPKLIEPYNNRGTIRSNAGDYQGAISDFEKVIQLQPDTPAAYFNLGLAQSKTGDRQGAITSFKTSARQFQEKGFLDLAERALAELRKLSQ